MIWFKDKKNLIKWGGGWVCWPQAILSSCMTACLDVESAGHVLWCRMSWSRAKTCCDIVYIWNILEKKSFSYKMVFDLKTKFASLKMNNITVINLKALAGRELWCRVSWPRAKLVEPACLHDWFKDKKSHIKMDGRVCWPRAILSSFMTACLDDKFYDRVLWYWVL